MDHNEVKAGQKYWVTPAFAGMQPAEDKKQIGKVVWVHPKRRYAVLEFEGVDGRPRECFRMDELTQIASSRRRKGLAV